MKLDDLIQADNTAPLDEDMTNALSVFGFSNCTYSLYQKQPSGEYVGVLSGEKPDGSTMNWIGTGKTPDDAYDEAVDALAKWIMSQPIPLWPASSSPPGATP